MFTALRRTAFCPSSNILSVRFNLSSQRMVSLGPLKSPLVPLPNKVRYIIFYENSVNVLKCFLVVSNFDISYICFFKVLRTPPVPPNSLIVWKSVCELSLCWRSIAYPMIFFHSLIEINYKIYKKKT